MLLRFRVTNHHSIKDTQELSMVAANLKGEGGHVMDGPGGLKVLPVALIYGANASGKSNVADAIDCMRLNALLSEAGPAPQQVLKRRPFSLDSESAQANSAFEMDFIQAGVRHQYGFEISDHLFVSEYLNSLPNGRVQVLFERKGSDFQFGRHLQGKNRVIAELTRPDRSFVSSARRSNHTQIINIFEFFRFITYSKDICFNAIDIFKLFRDEEIDKKIIGFLRKTGTGIIEVRKKSGVSIAADEMTQALRDLPPHEISFVHKGQSGQEFPLAMRDESNGTRRLLVVLAQTFHALEHGSLLVIDEIDASLHPHACEAIIAMFSSAATNPKGAQLICTTHDTNLLRSNFLRRDEAWFTEKNEEGVTSLYPLSDFHLRHTDDFERAYLQGRFGATPLSGSVSELILAD